MVYTLCEHTDHVIRDEDGAVIPFDPDNTDYKEYLAWLDEGNEPTAYVKPTQQPSAPKREFKNVEVVATNIKPHATARKEKK